MISNKNDIFSSWGGGGSLNIKVVGVPVGNFHDKHQKIPVNFSSTTFFLTLKNTKI